MKLARRSLPAGSGGYRELGVDPRRRWIVTVPRRLNTRGWRLGYLLALLTAIIAAALVGPAVLAPSHAPAAEAGVHGSCTGSGCADARAARAGWSQLGFPTTRGWYKWSGGEYNFAGGRFSNYERELPAGATYYEYDVYPRARGAHRDAVRIVVDAGNGATWYSPNHYTDFYRLT
jgi:ribonuclease T1